jgi:hypothetical protein
LTTRETSAEPAKDLREGADITTITQLILLERESRDLGYWETMRACFWPDSVVRVSWFRGNGPDFVTGSMDMAKRGIAAKHRLAPILVRLAEDRALASLAGIIDLPVKLKGVDATLSTYARFLYRVERRQEAWRLFGFDAVYLRDELTPAVSGQPIVMDPAEVNDFRPSYRILSYYLKSQGFTIDPALAGGDRPDLVDALYQELFGWARLPVPT